MNPIIELFRGIGAWMVLNSHYSHYLFDNYYTLWSLPQFQISVIPACRESFRKDSRLPKAFGIAGMTPKNKHSNNGRPAVSAAGRLHLRGGDNGDNAVESL
jgi:hypothetical protein